MTTTPDPAQLTARLIRCASVTPDEGGALLLLADVLGAAGFECHRVDREGVPNLFARWGAKGARSFGFNGHTDVVLPGDPASWTHPPFSGHEAEGWIWGRGATDMKSGVAAFVAAAIGFVTETPPPDGAVVLAITGDEEGPGKHGTRALLDWMAAHGERMDVCIVGEPSNPDRMGEMIKIGRRGSMTLQVEAHGIQGHAAYPHRARNPIHALLRLLHELTEAPLDEGTEHFDPSGLQVTTVDCGNPASNVIPERVRATINIRFNDAHTSGSLDRMIRARAAAISADTKVDFAISTDVSGESFLTRPGPFVDLVAGVVREETGLAPALSTSGGTSDARFVKDHCPVLEFGLVGHFMHQVDERVPAEQVRQLARIYRRILERYFA